MKRIEPTPSRAEQAYQAIVDQICDGTLAPGTHLVQEQLAERLGVSRQPIQQAMVRLKSDGLVEELGARGLHVAPFDLAAMEQRYAIRAALDELAVRLAAVRAKTSPDAAAAITRDGEALLAAGDAAVTAGDVSQMVHLDVDFHRFLYDASGNTLLADTAEPHWRYLRRVMGEVLRFAGPVQAIWRQHREILEAVVAGDPARAVERTRRHVGGAADRLKKAFDEGRLGAGPGAPGHKTR